MLHMDEANKLVQELRNRKKKVKAEMFNDKIIHGVSKVKAMRFFLSSWHSQTSNFHSRSWTSQQATTSWILLTSAPTTTCCRWTASALRTLKMGVSTCRVTRSFTRVFAYLFNCFETNLLHYFTLIFYAYFSYDFSFKTKLPTIHH